MTEARNRNQWLSMAAFLALHRQPADVVGEHLGGDKGAACGRRRSAAQAAPGAAFTLPVGNHGEINGKGRNA